ncbi:MAG: RpiB/LacA/LacB family sugar-phosphate isomerase, partial [Bryobacteraceae bacterium]
MRIALGADHAGYELKALLVELVASLGHQALDLGTCDTRPVDYPDFS